MEDHETYILLNDFLSKSYGLRFYFTLLSLKEHLFSLAHGGKTSQNKPSKTKPHVARAQTNDKL